MVDLCTDENVDFVLGQPRIEIVLASGVIDNQRIIKREKQEQRPTDTAAEIEPGQEPALHVQSQRDRQCPALLGLHEQIAGVLPSIKEFAIEVVHRAIIRHLLAILMCPHYGQLKILNFPSTSGPLAMSINKRVPCDNMG